jgi:aspartate kinase
LGGGVDAMRQMSPGAGRVRPLREAPLVVQKFGGSSLATADHIRRVAERIRRDRAAGRRLVVVVSAMGDTTDELLALLRQVTDRPQPREVDMLLTTGEQVSTALVASALWQLGVPAVSLTGWQAGIATDAVHRKAQIRSIDCARIWRELEAGKVVIVAGFQGLSPDGELTTLGRGGSDTTAVALAAALGADACEIYSDVDGVYTADPRVVPAARRIPVISYEEMMEMAHLGAQVLQIRAVECALIHGVEILARSTFTDGPGTRITGVEAVEDRAVARAVAHDRNVAKLALCGVPDRPGVAHRLFAALAAEHINVDMIIQSQSRQGRNDIAFTVDREDLEHAAEVARAVGRELGVEAVLAEAGYGKVSLVGAGMASNPGVAATMFGALAQAGINIEMISTSEIKISCLIRADRLEEAVRAVHAAFRLGGDGEEAAQTPAAGSRAGTPG